MTIDLEELRQKAAFEALQEERGTDEPNATVAFLVVQDTNGQWAAFHDYADREIISERAATLDDIIGGSSAVLSGAQSQQTAISTVLMMEQRAAQMQQHIMQQQEAQRVASLIDPKKLRNN